MEPSDYLTNVISCSHFALVHYEYFEPQASLLLPAVRHLQATETQWRQEGKLVHHDSLRGGIWLFSSARGLSSTDGEITNSGELQGVQLVRRDRGTYDPSSIAKSTQLGHNPLAAGNTTPPASLDNSFRHAQASNLRAVRQNSLQGNVFDASTLLPVARSGPDANEGGLKDMHEIFVTAVLGTIVYRLCHDFGYFPLNVRTLVLTPPRILPSSSPQKDLTSNEIILATLDVSLTSLGTLVIKAYSDAAPGLQSLVRGPVTSAIGSHLPIGSTIWLAPGGTVAKYHGLSDVVGSVEDESNRSLQAAVAPSRKYQFNGSTLGSWKSKCLEWLLSKGLNLPALDEGGWIMVQVNGAHLPYSRSDDPSVSTLDHDMIIPWPSLLCFQSPSASSDFSISNETSGLGSCEPLTFAEQWLLGREERAIVSSRRQKERHMADALAKEQADVDVRPIQPSFYSPTALRRSSNSGAMYPTPPDALHHPPGATPSFDGAASTPGNPNMFAPNDTSGTLDSSGVPPSALPISDVDTDMWDSPEKRPGQVTANFNENDNDNDNDNVNLFGDMTGGDLFGTDVTDADFSFFDEPGAILGSDLVPSPQPEPLPTEMVTSEDDTALEIPKPDPVATMDAEIRGADVDLLFDKSSAREEEQTNPHLVTYLKPERAEQVQKKVDTPFTKDTVYTRLVSGYPDSIKRNEVTRRSTFQQVDLESTWRSVNQKYSAHGHFGYQVSKHSSWKMDTSKLPQSESFNHRFPPQTNQDHQSLPSNFMHSAVQSVKPNDSVEYVLDSDGSVISEHDDRSNKTDEIFLPMPIEPKNGWHLEANNASEIGSPFENTAMEFENAVSTPKSVNGLQPPFLDANPADWSLTSYFTTIEPGLQSHALSDNERIAAAQLLADQFASSTLDWLLTEDSAAAVRSVRPISTRTLIQNLSQVMKPSLEDMTSCTLRTFSDIQGIPILNQALRLPPRPIQPSRASNMADSSKSNPFVIPPPQLEVRRSDARLSLLSSAVNFWENLGLGPSSGPKNVTAVCVYPNNEGVALPARIFLDQLRSMYESSHLGSHENSVFDEIEHGLLPFDAELSQHDQAHTISALKETTVMLSRILSSHPTEDHNFVVYFVYPTVNTALLVYICAAFNNLFSMYRKALADKKIDVSNELVLQLVPLDFIVTPTAIAVPSPSKYALLAMEVYDRCTNFTSQTSSPAIMLDQPLPRSIDFKLSVNPSASLLQENTCLHIAYAQSIDDRWITAAWTDNRGTQQMTASYCLGRKNEPLSMQFSEIAHEIWETTISFISCKKIHWRLIIARVGVMDPAEADFWMSLASTESSAQLSLTLVTIQPEPSLRLLPNAITLSPSGVAAPSTVTPVSTPQSSSASTLQHDNAPPTPTKDVNSSATPGEGDLDSDARLIDYTDQSWGCVLSHRLNNSNSLLELNPALISGYLLKRGGMNPEDPPIVIEVNIVYSEVTGNPRTFHESLLKELLGYYRGLATLARVRGIVDPVRDGRPWHVAAAEKAVKTLYMLM